MNWLDILYAVGRPAAYVAVGLGLYRIIKTRSTKSFSLTSWFIGLVIVFATFIRSLFSLHDFLFWLNGAVLLGVSVVQFVLIVRWRHQ